MGGRKSVVVVVRIRKNKEVAYCQIDAQSQRNMASQGTITKAIGKL